MSDDPSRNRAQTGPTGADTESPELDRAVRKVIGIFVLTLFVYITLFGACEAYRRRAGPWALTFDAERDGTPILKIHHPRILASGPVTIRFPGEQSPRPDLPITVVYTVAITNRMPFGPMLFVDTSTLPGTVALSCFGHCIEMVPRTLFFDLHEVAWTGGTTLVAQASTKPAPELLKARDQDWSRNQRARTPRRNDPAAPAAAPTR